MVQISASGVVIQPDALPQLRSEYRETGCAMMRGFLAPSVLRILLEQLQRATFAPRDEIDPQHDRVFGTTLKLRQSDSAVTAMNFILNRHELFELAMNVAGTAPLASFLGRLHRTVAASEQHIEWHQDNGDFRTLGLDINLSSQPYEGGLFQIRDADKNVRREIDAWEPGDAFLFRIGDGWHHRLTQVSSGERTVGVGWFRTQPDWRLFFQTGLRVRTEVYA